MASNLVAFLRDPIEYMECLQRAYGDIAIIGQGRHRYVFVFSPEYNRLVLADQVRFQALDLAASPVRVQPGTPMARLFTGLIQLNGAEHQRHRQLMLPSFQRGRIAAYHDSIVGIVEAELGSWQIGEVHDVLREMRQLMFVVDLRTLIGVDLLEGDPCLPQLLARWVRLVFSPATFMFPVSIPGMPYRRLLKDAADLEAAIRGIIKQKRMQAGHNDLLSVLVAAQDSDGLCFSDDELIGQIATLFVAGHEVIARALTWTVFLLSQHPRIMRDLVDELDGALSGRAPKAEQLSGLPLLDRVIKESLRLLPPIAWWSRVSSERVELGGYSLPAGTRVIVSQHVTHRLPALYSQPNVFLPQRWLTMSRGPYEYFPFSAGPRMCLGIGLAVMEMKVVLSILLQRYRLSMCPGSRVDRSGLLLSAPKNGLPMVIHRQDRQFRSCEVKGNILRLVSLSGNCS